MFGGYLEGILINLIQKDYKPLWFNSAKIIDDNTKYFAIGKTEGNTFYIINFINGKYPINEYMIKFNKLRDLVLSKIQNNTVFLNVFICEEENRPVTDFINKLETSQNLKCLPVFWSVIINNNSTSIFTGENQPKKILDIQNTLLKTKAGKNFQPIEVSKLIINALISDPVKPKLLFFKFSNILSIIYLLVFFSLSLTYGKIDTNALLGFGAISNARIYNYGEYFRLISSIFISGNIMHLIVTLLFLNFIGSIFEKYFGHIHFLGVFFLTSLIGTIIASLVSLDIYTGAFLGVIGLSSCLCVLSKAFSKTFNNLSFAYLFVISLLVLYYGYFMEFLNFYSTIGSFITGIILGIFIYIEIKVKQKPTKILE